MRGLILSAYDAQSHRFWRENLARQFSHIDWHHAVLPPRYFDWRVRGNPLIWSGDGHLTRGDFDLCFATSMVDLATLRGLLPRLASVPTALYFHENQFAYPLSLHKQQNIEPLMVQLYSSLSAEWLCFNSEYNRQSFCTGLAALLNRFPDRVPQGLVERLQKKSEILPVPLVKSAPAGVRGQGGTVLTDRVPNSLVWNHRWEYDKGPERLLALLHALNPALPLHFHVVGQAFRSLPAVFAEIRTLLEQRRWLGRWGYIEDRDEYLGLLAATQYVLSTALHDFQGISVLEAVQQGCIPLVPDRLAYRELFDPIYRYASDADPAVEARNMAHQLAGLVQNPELRAPAVATLEWPQWQARYQSVIDRLLGHSAKIDATIE